MQAMSLAAEDDAVEHNDMKVLMTQLEGTTEIVKALSRQLQVSVNFVTISNFKIYTFLLLTLTGSARSRDGAA